MRLTPLPLAAALWATTAANAQSPCASAPVPAQDACYATVDFFQYLTPQLGIALTGGNVILAQGGANGGLPRITIGVRANALSGNIPDVQPPRETGPAFWTAYPTKQQYLGLPVADASIGLFRGFDVGSVTIGGIDALVSATFVPTVDVTGAAGTFAIEPDSPIKIGYGGRIGLIEEGLWLPGLAVNVMLRDVPTTSLLATVGSDSLQVSDYSLKTMSWRVTTGKSFAGMSLAAGVGQDTYDGSTNIEAIVNRPAPIGRVTTGVIPTTQKITRLNYFANVALNLIVVKLVAEAGLISGGDILTSNIFDVEAGATRSYGSVGIRIGY
jgi:hypothetical protein